MRRASSFGRSVLAAARFALALAATRARRAARAAVWIALALAMAVAAPATAQDFVPAAPAGPAAGATALLERALPAAADRAALEAASGSWLGMPELDTRAAALLVPVRSLRLALGVSQTGDPELGWTCAALAVGCVADGAGFAVRAAGRRDRAAGALATSGLALGAGAEAGAGAWLAPAAGVTVWAQAPQLWTTGEAPPLARALELGARAESGGLAAWCALAAPRGGADGGERSAGLALARGPLVLWAEGRDGPVRGAIGLAASAGPLRIAARIEGHPVLGETAQVTLALRRGATRSAP